MSRISHLISGMTTGDARSALYYLSRFLKQAAQYENYGKDVFEDEERSYPSENVRATTLRLIDYIVKIESIPASEFDDDTYARWAVEVEEVEGSLDPEASDSELERATEFVNSIDLPATRRDKSDKI